jgi:hypothetical protein
MSEAKHCARSNGHGVCARRLLLSLQPRKQLSRVVFIQALHFFDRKFYCAHDNTLHNAATRGKHSAGSCQGFTLMGQCCHWA